MMPADLDGDEIGSPHSGTRTPRGNHHSGWCLTHNHDGCGYPHCTCPCHKETK